MAEYQTASTGGVLRASDGAFIPEDGGNRDWQDFLAWMANGNTPDPVSTSPAQDAAAELTTRLAAGIALTSTSNTALNAAYALDDTSTAQIYQLGLYASQFGTFPGGSVQPYPDATGVPHVFSVAEFVAFLRVVAPLVSALTTQAGIMAHGGPPTWPDQSATIP